MATVKKPQEFDLKKFNSMNPPFRIRIERKDPRRGLWEPIPLPQDVWSKEDAERIEQILLNDISGGGHYKGAMIDSAGTTMEWVFAYNPEYFPPKIPPGSAAALGSPPPSPSMPQVGGQPMPPQAAGWHPGYYGNPVSPPAAPFVPSYAAPQQPQSFSPFGYGSYMSPFTPSPFSYQSPPVSTSRSSKDDSTTEHLRQQLDAMKQSAAEERHAREREAAEARHREQMGAMQTKFADEMRQMREMMADQKRPRGDDDPMIAALKQQADAMKQQMEEQRRQLESERAEARHREEMRQLQDNSQRQIDALKELISKSTESKEDPQMRMLVELQRQQFDSQREATRAQAEASRESTRLAAEQPRTMVEMMERLRAASGSEQMLTNIANAYKGVNEMQMQVMEMMANMGQSPGMALAEGALASGKEVLERFIQAKQSEAVAKERTNQIQSQERATAYQAQAWAAQQQPYRYEDGSIKGEPPQREQLAGAEEEEEAENTAPDPTAPKERDIFGPLYEEVRQLREVIDELEPAQVADIIVQAATAIHENNLLVPAFSLLTDKRYAELIDILLPGVSSEFAGECVAVLTARLKELGIDPPVVNLDGDAPPNGSTAASA